MSRHRAVRPPGHRKEFHLAQGRRGRDAESGSATVLALGVIAVLITTLLALSLLAAAVAARQQAQLAADLSALAGAQSLRHGAGAAAVCDRVAHFVQQNNATVDACTVRTGQAESSAPEVRVSTSVRVRLGPGWTARASARAGLVAP
ncbi:MAG: Rv3654c family TadE-like protein [Ornithinimicrobium sp.]